MKRLALLLGWILSLLAPAACKKAPEPAAPAERPGIYVVGIFQSVDSPTADEVRKGILQAFNDSGLRDGENVRVRIRIANGDISEVQRIAREFVEEKVDLVIPLSTQCLQAALIAGRSTPIVFGSVATPFLVGAGRTPDDHLSYVTGVASTGPVRQAVKLIHEVLPGARRLGTLWTPSEVNSEYYLDLAQEAAAELGLEIVAIPVASAQEIPQSAQILVNAKVDVLFPISDNTINTSFDALGRAAEENRLPLFAVFLRSVEFGACAAVGYDFHDMGYKTGQVALRVKNGESPARIPIQFMTDVKVALNLAAAEKQGVVFPKEILARAVKIIRPAPGTGPAGDSASRR
ncbi:MAG: ABC transporter substrate-binding protein [Candidatus Aminicenantales bacterium]|jgi:putative ABC transport system substrate-binding protein